MESDITEWGNSEKWDPPEPVSIQPELFCSCRAIWFIRILASAFLRTFVLGDGFVLSSTVRYDISRAFSWKMRCSAPLPLGSPFLPSLLTRSLPTPSPFTPIERTEPLPSFLPSFLQRASRQPASLAACEPASRALITRTSTAMVHSHGTTAAAAADAAAAEAAQKRGRAGKEGGREGGREGGKTGVRV